MSDPVKSSPSLSSLVDFVGAEVTSADVDAYSKYQDVENRGKKVAMVLDAWTQQENHYRTSRERYANYIICAFLIQSILINVAFMFLGFKIISVDRWVAQSFILGVFGEMTALTFIVFKYFFPSSPSKMGDLVEKL